MAPNLGLYEPATDRWTYLARTARLMRPAVFTGSEILLFTGFDERKRALEGMRIPLP
jgi:hypothetical protein